MKFAFTTIIAFFVACTTLVQAQSFLARFHNGLNCQGGASPFVHDIRNSRCITDELNRRSVYVPDTRRGVDNSNLYCLVQTRADGHCSCQTRGHSFFATGRCFPVDPLTRSYSFHHGACRENSCHGAEASAEEEPAQPTDA